MIRWREKLTAFAIHFVATAAFALAAAALIFLVWYPAPYHEMMGGTALFLLVTGCDLVLGPLISLVIYDSRKSRRKLLLDYAGVVVLQLAALAYGVYVVWGARPVYVVFVGDRFEAVAAADIDDADLQAASDAAYRRRPGWGPELVATFVPPEDRDEVLFAALEGKDVQVRPRYYVRYETQLDKLRQRAAPLADLAGRQPRAAPLLDVAQRELGVPEDQLRLLPIRVRQGFWTVLVDLRDGKPLRYLPIDPYESDPP